MQLENEAPFAPNLHGISSLPEKISPAMNNDVNCAADLSVYYLYPIVRDVRGPKGQSKSWSGGPTK
jgi:hypothetical protein